MGWEEISRQIIARDGPDVPVSPGHYCIIATSVDAQGKPELYRPNASQDVAYSSPSVVPIPRKTEEKKGRNQRVCLKLSFIAL